MPFEPLLSKEIISNVLMSSFMSVLISWYYNKRKEINNHKSLCFGERKEIINELRMIFPYEDRIVNRDLIESPLNPLKLNEYRSDIDAIKLKSKRVFPAKYYLDIFDLLERIEEALSKEKSENLAAFILDYNLGSLTQTVEFIERNKDIKDYFYLVVSKRLEDTINLNNHPSVLFNKLKCIEEIYYRNQIKKREEELIKKRKNYDNIGKFTL